MRASSIALCRMLLSFAGIAGIARAESWTGARPGSPNSVMESLPSVGLLEIPSATFSEGFDGISTLESNGWDKTDNSRPLGGTAWFQGNTTAFSSQFGRPEAYVGANYNNSG